MTIKTSHINKRDDFARVSLHILLIWTIAVYLLNSCGTETAIECIDEETIPCIPADEPHRQLSDYSFFKGTLNDLEPVDGILPFDLNTPLFTDYAQKLRMIYVPEDATVTYREDEMMAYPVGTVLIKNFFYDLDRRDPTSGRRLVETRLLMHQQQGWRAETYVWNEQQDEALLQQTGDRVQVTWKDGQGVSRMVDYLIQTKNDCKSCHSIGNTLVPLGPKAQNLNRDYSYADGPANQLVRWEQVGILSGKPGTDVLPKMSVWDDSSTGTLNERARAYLDVNCGHCHKPNGSAYSSGLFLTSEVQDPFRLGVCKPPVAFGAGNGGLRYDIVPCKPDNSIMVFRMSSVEPEERMPELGRTLVHKEGVALIKEWIESMECTSCANSE